MVHTSPQYGYPYSKDKRQQMVNAIGNKNNSKNGISELKIILS